MYRIRNTSKQKTLLQQDKRILTTSDLSILWEITNKNTLWTTIKRYIDKGVLYKIQKGLYSTMPIDKLHKYELVCAICGPLSYVTTETVLQNEGLIMQQVNTITLMGARTKKGSINNINYICRKLGPQYLLNRAGINDTGTYSIATTQRALLDMNQINPRYYIDNEEKMKTIKVSELIKNVYK